MGFQRTTVSILSVVSTLFIAACSQAAIIYVDSRSTDTYDGKSWSTAFSKLQDAMAIAVTGDEIRVAQGTYRPDETLADPNGTGDRYAAFTPIDGITLLGGYAGLGAADPDARVPSIYKTILSGDLDQNDLPVNNASLLLSDPARAENSYHVIKISNAAPALVLDGFTISGGLANGAEPEFNGGAILLVASSPTIANCRFEYNAAANGGAIYNLASSPTLTDCVFLRNYAQNTGGAIRNINSASPALSACTFIENKAAAFGGAIGNREGSSPTVHQCAFIANWANRGGVFNNYDACSPHVTDSTFRQNITDNTGGVMRNEINSDPNLINCRFYTNIGTHGAVLYNLQSSPLIINCVASGNIAVEYGGVLYNDQAAPNIINCTFADNTAQLHGADIYNLQSSPVIINSILWNTLSPGTEPIYSDQGTPAVSYSCIQGGWPDGIGNIDTDPLFLNPAGPDGQIGTSDDQFQLTPASPCIDVADNTAIPVNIQTDIDNRHRTADGNCDGTATVDMGAYEFSSASLGDFDLSCTIDLKDLATLTRAWLTVEGDSLYNPACDLSIPPDKQIDIDDLEILAANWLL